MQGERNNENGEETTSELNGDFSIEGGETAKIDIEAAKFPVNLMLTTIQLRGIKQLRQDGLHIC